MEHSNTLDVKFNRTKLRRNQVCVNGKFIGSLSNDIYKWWYESWTLIDTLLNSLIIKFVTFHLIKC